MLRTALALRYRAGAVLGVFRPGSVLDARGALDASQHTAAARKAGIEEINEP